MPLSCLVRGGGYFFRCRPMVIPKVIAAIMSRCNAMTSPALIGLTSWVLLVDRPRPFCMVKQYLTKCARYKCDRHLSGQSGGVPVFYLCGVQVGHFVISTGHLKTLLLYSIRIQNAILTLHKDKSEAACYS